MCRAWELFRKLSHATMSSHRMFWVTVEMLLHCNVYFGQFIEFGSVAKYLLKWMQVKMHVLFAVEPK